MAIIRDNRGQLLASNLSSYLASAANTAGTPINTTELVGILNQFLGEGEQLSSDITTITNGIYKKFGSIDKVTNRTEVVTSGIWSGDTGSLATFFTSSAQIVGVSGKYYIDVYSDAGIQNKEFSIAYGDSSGLGSPTYDQSDDTYRQSLAVYNQFKNILLDSSDTNFSVYNGTVEGGYDLTSFYALAIDRARYKEQLDPGNFQLTLSGSLGTITLIDDSGQTETVGASGRIFNVVNGSLNIGQQNEGTINSPTASNGQGFGLFYPDMGIILLNPNALSASVGVDLRAANGSQKDVYHNNSLSGSTYSINSGSVALFKAISGGADFQMRRTENVSTSHYFVRANNREFNFSNNPTFVTGSTGQFVESTFETNPKVYITTVGLYDDGNELLAVAKISKPIEKSFDKEVAIKVKLDF
jgi:hypothetical protein